MDETISVLYMNAEGAGFADTIQVAKGTTVGQLFKQKMPGQSAGQYKIKVDRDIAPEDLVLQDGSKISITPEKVGGSY